MAYYFSVEVRHEGLNKYRIVKGQTPREANAKANALSLQWAEQWERKCEAERNRKRREADQLKRERTRLEHEANAAEAVRLTLEAEQLHLRMGSILLDSLKIKPKSWTDFHDKSKFTDKEPNSPRTEKLLPLPLRTAYKYNPELSFLQKISKNENTGDVSLCYCYTAKKTHTNVPCVFAKLASIVRPKFQLNRIASDRRVF